MIHHSRTNRSIVQIILIASLAIFLGLATSGLAADQIPDLLIEAPHLAAPRLNPGLKAVQTFLIDRAVLRALIDNTIHKISIPVLEDTIVFEKERHKSKGNTTTWIGTEVEGDAKIVITIGGDHIYARVETNDIKVLYSPGDSPFQVVTLVANPAFEIMPYENDIVTAPPAPPLMPHPPPLSAQGTGNDDGATIDVMILYTSGMAAAHPGSQIDTRIQHLINVTNDIFDRSEIDTQLRLVHSAEVDYTDDSPGGMNEALLDVTNNVGVFSNVEALRTYYGADQVTLLRRFVDEACGIAWLINGSNASWNANSAYAVVHDGYKTDGSGMYCNENVLAHEFGHNAGCTHDVGNANYPGRYSYSYGYQHPTGQFRTVMAYSYGCPGPGDCIQIDYFSNPNVTYNGAPTGTASANCAETIQQTRVEMAGYRQWKPSQPAMALPGIINLLLIE